MILLRERLLLFGLGLLAALLLVSVAAPLLVDLSLAEIGAARPRRPPGPGHPLGTDTQGRDVLAALLLALPVRAQVLSLRERPWVDIARLNGIGPLRLIATELLPNLVPYLAASFVTAVSGAMLATVGLEALGLGPHNELTLGMMFYWAQYGGAVLRGMWWWWVPPVVALVLIFVALLAASAGMDRLVNARLRVES